MSLNSVGTSSILTDPGRDAGASQEIRLMPGEHGALGRGRAHEGVPGVAESAEGARSPCAAAGVRFARPLTPIPPNVGRHGWVEVRLDGVDPEEMQELVTEAWCSTAPMRAVAEFDGD